VLRRISGSERKVDLREKKYEEVGGICIMSIFI
jgi:hypothetical protein